MIGDLFHTGIYLPLYNALIFLIDVIPGGDVGLAVIGLTVVVRFLIFPLAHSAIKTQMAVRLITPELEEIQKQYKDNREELGRRTLDLYKKNDIHIFAPFMMILVQLPILIGLYFVFLNAGLPSVNTEALYSFIPAPEAINMHFLGFIDIAGKSIILAFLAAATQFVYAKLSLPPPKKDGEGFKHDLARSFHIQMLYVFPALIGIFAYTFSAAIGLYFVISNLFSIGQELLVHRKMRAAQEVKQ